MINRSRRILTGEQQEKGAVLLLTLIMLAITMTVIIALVSYMVTGAKTGVMYEQKNNELYTADAGVNDAIQFIAASLENDINWTPSTTPYLLSEKYGDDVNGNDAQVIISEYIRDGIKYYKIFSEGQTPVVNQETTITAFVNVFDAYGWSHCENAFTSPETLDFKSGHGGSIIGGAQLPQGQTGQGDIDFIDYSPITGWPDRSYFIDYYSAQVEGAGNIADILNIDKNENMVMGSINKEGNLTINPEGDGSLTLEGSPEDTATTVWYIHGDLVINRVDKNGAFDINLNGQTIFLEGSITQETNSGNKVVQFNGPGAIIALGDISFAPAAAYDSEGEPDPTKYIYIASIEGSVNIWPRGAFVGSILAREASTIQPSTQIIFLDDPTFGGLNLPSSDTTTHEIVLGAIESWIIDDPSGNNRIHITPFWLRPGEIGYDYASEYAPSLRTLYASGGTAPYEWTIVSGTLPGGLGLDSSGIISGVPSETGKFYFTAQAADSSDPPKTGTQVIVIDVNALPEILTAGALPAGQAGIQYSEFILSRGGTPTYIWSITSGQLPDGLEILSTGNIVGVPAASGDYTFTVTLTDAYGASDSKTMTITIDNP